MKYRDYEIVNWECDEGDCLLIHERITDSKLGWLSVDHLSIAQGIVKELNTLSDKIEELMDERDKIRVERDVFVERCLESMKKDDW